MKDQYVGDVGDFGKYGLLRYLNSCSLKIGVNWYLTPRDDRTDGNHTEYLEDRRMRGYDADLFDAMKKLAFRRDKGVSLVEQSGMLEGVRFYSSMMDFDSLDWRERAEARDRWHKDALSVLEDAELVFADPDNGLSSTQKPTKKGAQKFILPGEIIDYFHRGQQVLYYQHRPRKGYDGWMKDKSQIKSSLPEACLLAVSFNRWSCRTYIFVVHEDKYDQYRSLIDGFLASPWGRCTVNGKLAFIKEPV
ncbi:MAG: hypothetical protein IKN89_08095 [Oscillospiraceae bacterium]|nr:hypothetical protein [Oscillospiraceae bacterium]